MRLLLDSAAGWGEVSSSQIIFTRMWRAVALLIEHENVNRENLCSNPLLSGQTLGNSLAFLILTVGTSTIGVISSRKIQLRTNKLPGIKTDNSGILMTLQSLKKKYHSNTIEWY